MSILRILIHSGGGKYQGHYDVLIKCILDKYVQFLDHKKIDECVRILTNFILENLEIKFDLMLLRHTIAVWPKQSKVIILR